MNLNHLTMHQIMRLGGVVADGVRQVANSRAPQMILNAAAGVGAQIYREEGAAGIIRCVNAGVNLVVNPYETIKQLSSAAESVQFLRDIFKKKLVEQTFPQPCLLEEVVPFTDTSQVIERVSSDISEVAGQIFSSEIITDGSTCVIDISEPTCLLSNVTNSLSSISEAVSHNLPSNLSETTTSVLSSITEPARYMLSSGLLPNVTNISTYVIEGSVPTSILQNITDVSTCVIGVTSSTCSLEDVTSLSRYIPNGVRHILLPGLSQATTSILSRVTEPARYMLPSGLLQNITDVSTCVIGVTAPTCSLENVTSLSKYIPSGVRPGLSQATISVLSCAAEPSLYMLSSGLLQNITDVSTCIGVIGPTCSLENVTSIASYIPEAVESSLSLSLSQVITIGLIRGTEPVQYILSSGVLESIASVSTHVIGVTAPRWILPNITSIANYIPEAVRLSLSSGLSQTLINVSTSVMKVTWPVLDSLSKSASAMKLAWTVLNPLSRSASAMKVALSVLDSLSKSACAMKVTWTVLDPLSKSAICGICAVISGVLLFKAAEPTIKAILDGPENTDEAAEVIDRLKIELTKIDSIIRDGQTRFYADSAMRDVKSRVNFAIDEIGDYLHTLKYISEDQKELIASTKFETNKRIGDLEGHLELMCSIAIQGKSNTGKEIDDLKTKVDGLIKELKRWL